MGHAHALMHHQKVALTPTRAAPCPRVSCTRRLYKTHSFALFWFFGHISRFDSDLTLIFSIASYFTPIQDYQIRSNLPHSFSVVWHGFWWWLDISDVAIFLSTFGHNSLLYFPESLSHFSLLKVVPKFL